MGFGAKVRANPILKNQRLHDMIRDFGVRYEDDGYPPDVPGRIIYNVTYPKECWGCGYKKGNSVCPYCGTF